MRSIGFVVIVIGIVLFIVGGIVETNASEERDIYEESHDYETAQREAMDNNMLASWLEGFSQILVFASIGFILYDVAMKGENKTLSGLREGLKGEKTKIEESVMLCPHCNQKFRFLKSMVGSVGKCPLCDEEIKLQELLSSPPS